MSRFKPGHLRRAIGFSKFARRNKVALATVAIVAISLVVGTIVSVWEAARARHAEALAEIRLKNETEARRQATAISDILQQMLQSADPYTAKGGEYTVRQMLDDFSAELGDKLKDQPATEAAIRAIIGQTYRQLGMTDKAESHLKAALDLRRQAFGTDHELVAQSLIDYAWFLRAWAKQPRRKNPPARLSPFGRSSATCDPTLMLANLHLLQNIAASQHRYDEAEQFAQQALEIAHAQPKPALRRGQHFANARRHRPHARRFRQGRATGPRSAGTAPQTAGRRPFGDGSGLGRIGKRLVPPEEI